MLKWWLCLLPFICSPVFAKVWTSNRAWDVAAEDEYSQWISSQGPDLFKKLGVATDCADAVIGARWIFSKLKSLPAANTLSSGKVFSSDSSEFDFLAEGNESQLGPRFFAALRKVIGDTDTKTLFVDSYPVSLGRASLAPGAFFLKPGHDMGHAELIGRLDLTGGGFPITFFASTVPARTRDLLVYPFLKLHAPDLEIGDGFRRMRWAVSSARGIALQAGQQMPWYSLEQYHIDSGQGAFDEKVFERLGISFDRGNKLQSLVWSLIERFQSRYEVVKEGVKNCSLATSKCAPSSELFDSYSTYARDASILFLIDGLTELINSSGERSAEIQRNLGELEKTEVIDIQGHRLQFGEILLVWKRALYSSDPRLGELERWGMH